MFMFQLPRTYLSEAMNAFISHECSHDRRIYFADETIQMRPLQIKYEGFSLLKPEVNTQTEELQIYKNKGD